MDTAFAVIGESNWVLGFFLEVFSKRGNRCGPREEGVTFLFWELSTLKGVVFFAIFFFDCI